MKKLLNTLVLALFAQAVLAQQTIVPTTYRGAFEPAPAAAWTEAGGPVSVRWSFQILALAGYYRARAGQDPAVVHVRCCAGGGHQSR